MKKRVCALCAALVLVCSLAAPALAISESWFNKWEDSFQASLSSPYWIAENWGDKNQYSFVYSTSEFSWITATLEGNGTRCFLRIKNPANSSGSGFEIPVSGLAARKLAWNFTIPVCASNTDNTIVGYLYPNPNGMGGNFYYAEPYDPNHGGGSGEPEYGIENDWLTNTVGEGAYIIAPKNGKVFNGKDATTQIVAQYRFQHRKVLLGSGWHTTMQFKGYNKTLGMQLSGDIWTGLIKFKDTSTNIVSHDEKVVTDANGKEWLEGTIIVQGKTPRNCEVEVQLSASYTGPQQQQHIVYESNKVTFSWYEDVVDVDGDGNDDRDKDPSYKPDLSNPDGNLSLEFDNIIDVLKSISTSVLSFVAFLKECFSFFPVPMFAMFAAFIGVVMLMRILGR